MSDPSSDGGTARWSRIPGRDLATHLRRRVRLRTRLRAARARRVEQSGAHSGRAERSSPRATRAASASHMRAGADTDALLAQLQSDVERVLESALSQRVLSQSPHQATGGAYQTIRLGERTRGG